MPPSDTRPRPILIGPKNAEAATGLPWRWLREHADELGVAVVRVGQKSFIQADQLVAALAARAPTAPPPEEVDELAAMRERVRRAG